MPRETEIVEKVAWLLLCRVKQGEESRPGGELSPGTQLNSRFKVTAGLYSGERPQGVCPVRALGVLALAGLVPTQGVQREAPP